MNAGAQGCIGMLAMVGLGWMRRKADAQRMHTECTVVVRTSNLRPQVEGFGPGQVLVADAREGAAAA